MISTDPLRTDVVIYGVVIVFNSAIDNESDITAGNFDVLIEIAKKNLRDH